MVVSLGLVALSNCEAILLPGQALASSILQTFTGALDLPILAQPISIVLAKIFQVLSLSLFVLFLILTL